MKGRYLRIIAAIAMLLVIWSVAAPILARFLIVEKPLEKADAIIVLSGAAAYKERTRKAASLYRQGVAPRIFITNDGQCSGWSEADKKNLIYVELERRELISNGVDPEAIEILKGTVAGTGDEAVATAREIEARPIGSLLVVTSPYHTRRALNAFERLLEGTRVDVGIVVASDPTHAPVLWWFFPSGWRLVVGEYVKSAVYYFYY
jgi:uncharacterized SAM-binding protein YcdF (DUF218 family)